MTTYSALRLFFRLEKPGKLQTFGNVGLLYTTSILERHHRAFLFNHDPKIRNTYVDNLKKFRIPVIRYFSTAVSTTEVIKSDTLRESGGRKKAKTAESPKVMLISETKSISVVTFEEAQKIALHKNLHLVQDNSQKAKVKTEKPVYKLVTNTEFLKLEIEEQADSSKDFRSDKEIKKKGKENEFKTVILKSKTADNDVQSKIKQMVKWIEKGQSIRVMIGQAGDVGDPGHVFKTIEEDMKESGARFLQKIVKEGQIRFQIAPPKVLPKQQEATKKHNTSESQSHEEGL